MVKAKQHQVNRFMALLVVAVILLGVMVCIMWRINRGSDFYAVYLQTGDVYFGRLSRLPFGLSQVYTLQVNPQNQQVPINIQKFTNVFWGPSDFMKINREQVVWVTKLNPKSQLVELLKNNPNLTPSEGVPANLPQEVAPSAQTPSNQ